MMNVSLFFYIWSVFDLGETGKVSDYFWVILILWFGISVILELWNTVMVSFYTCSSCHFYKVKITTLFIEYIRCCKIESKSFNVTWTDSSVPSNSQILTLTATWNDSFVRVCTETNVCPGRMLWVDVKTSGSEKLDDDGCWRWTGSREETSPRAEPGESIYWRKRRGTVKRLIEVEVPFWIECLFW